MTANLKLNRFALIISIIGAALSLLFAIRRLHFFNMNIYLAYFLDITSEIVFLLSIAYLIMLLKLTGQKKFILVAFYILLCCSLIFYIFGFVPHTMTMETCMSAIVSLNIVYLAVVMFYIKDPVLTGPFKICAIAYVITIVCDMIVPLVLPVLISFESYFQVTRYMGFVRVIPLLAIVFVIYKAAELFKSPKIQPT